MSGGQRGIRRLLGTGLWMLGACLAALLLFDVLAYLFAPASLTGFALYYRKPAFDPFSLAGYYRSDPVLGHDIVPGQSGRHSLYVAGHGYVPTSSNDLGCRDPRSLADVRRLREYTYFAGDSFTFGFVRGDRSFPRAYERASGNPSLNCGVEGTGALHQLEKFRRTVRAIGRHPDRVVLSFFPNDPRDDLWYPRYTVVRGMEGQTSVSALRTQARGLVLAGKAGMADPRGKDVIRYRRFLGRGELEELALRAERRHSSLRHKAHSWLRRHSLAYQVLVRLALGGAARPSRGLDVRGRLGPRGPIPPGAEGPPRDYARDPYTRPHRQALKAWAEHAEKHGYELAVVMIPPGFALPHPPDRRWRQVLAHLDSLGMRSLDFFAEVRRRGLRREQLYWRHDGHLHGDGNRILGEWLAGGLP